MGGVTGPPLYPGSTTFPGSTTYPGQGDLPQIEVLYSTDDATAASPNWSYVPFGSLRGYSVDRGRSSELEEFDAGHATITLNNRARTFDPNTNALLAPMNQWWIRSKFAGETQDRFKGYADSYILTWPATGLDSVTTVNCSDEFKILNLDNLAVMDPPSESYADVVAFDTPTGYWSFSNDIAGNSEPGSPGPNLNYSSGAWASGVPGAIIGEPVGPTGFQYITSSSGGGAAAELTTGAVNADDDLDFTAAAEFTAEVWFLAPVGFGPPVTNADALVNSPACLGGAGNTHFFRIEYNTTGTITVRTRNQVPTDYTITSTSAISLGVWHHIVATIESGSVRLYIDGAQVASTAFSGTLNTLSAPSALHLGETTNEQPYQYDELAVYRHGLSASRVLAHYNAGTARGYSSQNSGRRIYSILDDVDNQQPRNIRTGARNVQARFQTGQPPLDEIRAAKNCDNAAAMFFIARDGTVTYLDAAHRSNSPWNTVQAIFDDDGTDLQYLDVEHDVSEAFLFNVWNVTRQGGVLETAQDATSISRYKRRIQALTGLLVTTEFDALAVASAMLAKYKDPLQRIPDIKPNMADITTAVSTLRLEIAYPVEIIRRPVLIPSAIDQTAYIQSIQESAVPSSSGLGVIIDMTLGVSPV